MTLTPAVQMLVDHGFCVDEWERWHLGQCGTYALTLIQLEPRLRLGLIGDLEQSDLEGEPPSFLWHHAIAHDDHFAYDAAGRHPLPYRGAWGYFEHQELDCDPRDYDFLYEEAGPDGPLVNIDAAIAHISRNGILAGRFQPDHSDMRYPQ